jgi:hypothetical protein
MWQVPENVVDFLLPWALPVAAGTATGRAGQAVGVS